MGDTTLTAANAEQAAPDTAQQNNGAVVFSFPKR